MECDDSRNQMIQEFVSRVRTIPYGAMLETNEATKIAKLFLRARKFDVNRALELYKSYKHMRYSNQLEAIDPLEEGVRRELLSEKFTVLSHSSSLDPTVMVFTVRRHWPPNCTDRDVLKGIIYQLDAALLDEQTQEQGVTVIYDMTDAKYSNFGADLSMKLLNLLTGSYPARIRNILIVAAPFWFRPPYHLSRLFVKDKIRERIFAIERRQLINFLPLTSIPQSLGGSLPHRHLDWLRTCFDRLGAVLPNEDYFNPIKAVPSLLSASATLPLHSVATMAAKRRVSLNQNQLHHFPHQRLSNGGGSSVNRVNSVTPLGRGTWTYNRLLRPDASMNSSSSVSVSNDEVTTTTTTKNNQDDIVSITSATRISVAQFLAEFPRKFPTTFEREFETSIRQFGGGSCGVGGNASASRFSSRINWPKNRYVDVPCLDHSAVPLPNDAYIHANFVDGYKRRKAYILTQGPLESTAVDFWQMVWTTGASIIIMLTRIVENGRVKCGQYWPPIETNYGHSSSASTATKRFPPFSVTNVQQTVEANGLYQLSRLHLSKSQGKITAFEPSNPTSSLAETRKIEHYLFLGWPDFDVPKEPHDFLTFLDVINERLRQSSTSLPTSPLIIHCSAGIGRTGTFTAIDICLAQAKAEGYVDVPGVVTRIRQQRACSVQLAKQYAFIYQAVYTRLRAIM
uniref:Tyrosine protein phosphatase non receptor type n=1 Tax=Echinococcus granulosus TaxID=6210 RepID=A0A068WUT7_ECHGR|nr:tyrosine protein phosphatase non receptor type [Echinococcus granulosus]